jgi:competence CoiA-like predicted nuclease
MSQFCFINNEQIHVQTYITQNNKQKITCQKGHELILVNGNKNIAHFRHKNSNDVGGNPMTLWHCEWQSHFPITETTYPKKQEQIKTRRADVVINDKKILEIQHSKCDKEEVDNRKHDYLLHGINIYWLIDGNQHIDVKILKFSNRVFLEFTSDYWKYESFKSYEYIFIDINSIIYKVYPNKVKSHMIDVENGKTKEEFIKSLINDCDIWDNEEPNQCNLFVKQQGAGNGKTHGIIKMLEDDDKSHYTNFIYITKQHSAKHIIKTEFETQKENFQYLKNIEITEKNKKYIIKYFNEKSKSNCQIIVSTIDSFTYSIGNKNHKHFDKFEGLIYSIIDGHIETKNCGSINFGGLNPKLNKATLLVIDEFQDPPEHYAKAIIQIMRNKYIDVFIVGDKLQSISNEKNAFTFFLENEFPLINTIKLEPINICRRFIHPKLVDFVNCMIPFKKYGLPEIKPYKEYVGEETNPLIFFTSNKKVTINNNINIIDETEKIMEYYKNEVNENNRFPEDFLIVTPFTAQNPLVDSLLLSINIYWQNKFTDEIEYMKNWKYNLNIDIDVNKYYRYAIFHKSQDGTSIDLSESEYSTRIVSCHASKGDGRKVVFIIGFNESALKIFSQKSNNLVYDSLFHVGITRMKEKLYIRYENNADEIAKKINKYRQPDIICEEIEPNIINNNYIKYNDIIKNSTDKSYELFVEHIINSTDLEVNIENNDNDEKRVVDMGNHIIRYSSLYINILLEIVNKEKTDQHSKLLTKQIIAILYNISNSDVTQVNNTKEYYTSLKCEEIPIIKISNKGKDYINYFNAILCIANHLKIKIKNLLNQNVQLMLCPLECIILNYMIEIIQNKEYSNINIVEIYDIVDLYNSAFNNDIIDGHQNCLCQKYFNKYNIQVTNKKIDSLKLYLFNHFEKINNIKNIMVVFHKKFPKINWLIHHYFSYNGNNNFKIGTKFNLIGYDENMVLITYINPQFNSLNYNNILINSIFDTYFINNIQKYDKEGKITPNYEKFNGKKVITCIFTLDQNEPYYIDWHDSITNNFDIIKNRIYFNIVEKYKLESGNLYYFYKYWKMFCPDNEKHPSNFIRFLKEKLQKIDNESSSRSLPKYIFDFIFQIEFEIENSKGKTKKELILTKYENYDYFVEKIEKKLHDSAKRYLGMNIDDDSDNDD